MTELQIRPSLYTKKNQNTLVKTILFPTDFSPTAENAFKYALHMADHLGAKIVLLHSYNEELLSSYLAPQRLKSALQADNIEKALAYFESYKKQAQDALNTEVEIELILEYGSAEKIITHRSIREQADLIIMGTQGAASESSRLFGSVTSQVIERAACPVLAVPIECSYSPIQKMLYALQMKEEDFAIIDQLLELCAILQTSLTCVHISTNEDYLEGVEFDEFKLYYEGGLEVKNINFELIKDKDVFTGLQHYINQNQADAIAMTTHKRDIFRKIFDVSLTKEMMLYTDLPLFAFQGRKYPA